MSKQRDPIFALIADHKSKQDAWEKAKAARERLETKLDAKADHQAKAEKRLLSHPYPPLWLGHAWPIYGTRGCKTHVRDRLAVAGGDFGPKMQRKLKALAPLASKEIEAMLQAFHADHRRKRDAAGITVLHKRERAAISAWSKSRTRMISTAPRTPEGAVALADALADFEWNDTDLQRGMRALARAVKIASKQKDGSRPQRSKT